MIPIPFAIDKEINSNLHLKMFIYLESFSTHTIAPNNKTYSFILFFLYYTIYSYYSFILFLF